MSFPAPAPQRTSSWNGSISNSIPQHGSDNDLPSQVTADGLQIRRQRRSFIVGDVDHILSSPPSSAHLSIASAASHQAVREGPPGRLSPEKLRKWNAIQENRRARRLGEACQHLTAQTPAILIAVMLVLMGAVPFGVAYFPIFWRSDATDVTEDGGPFPIAGKAELGIRMCLFSTFMGQLGYGIATKFDSAIVFQLVENVPFYHALAQIVIEEQGYGFDALASLFFLFGFGSLLLSATSFLLGYLELGNIVYFFPSHVLVGCIAGIGVFLIVTSIEVADDLTLTYDMDGFTGFVEYFYLYGIVLVFEVGLRLIKSFSIASSPFIGPLYFCSIIPAVYLYLWACNIDVATAKADGYFLPDPFEGNCSSGQECEDPGFFDRMFDGHTWDIFGLYLRSFQTITWKLLAKSAGTLIAMVAFSLLQVPIMIPAFAVSSSDGDCDMNAELKAHGWSNAAAGIFGGVQNVMTYSFSILYHKSGGRGLASSCAVVVLTAVMFFVGPAMAVFLPRAMAATLLLHIGVDLVLEGLYDSYGVYDGLEYAGICFIMVVMTAFGMTAALLAGVLAALSTYAVQSIAHTDPVFRVMSAATLRSSVWNRSPMAMEVLEDPLRGSSRVLILQLQGHIFFGNVVKLTDDVKAKLRETEGTDEEPRVMIFDFTLVVGLDSSAAMAVEKLKKSITRKYAVEMCIFVRGSYRESFPCQYALSDALCSREGDEEEGTGEKSYLLRSRDKSKVPVIPDSDVCANLDEALMIAEEVLIWLTRPDLYDDERQRTQTHLLKLGMDSQENMTVDQELVKAADYITNLLPRNGGPDVEKSVEILFSKFKRETYKKFDIVWKQGDESESAKVLISGSLVARIEGTDSTEIVPKGNVLGELGLIYGIKRLSTVQVASNDAVLYSLDKKDWEDLCMSHPSESRVLYLISIRYLTNRVQHVNNRVLETRLPV